jgi:hypothetical protein
MKPDKYSPKVSAKAKAFGKWDHDLMLTISGNPRTFQAWKWVWHTLEWMGNPDRAERDKSQNFVLSMLRTRMLRRDAKFFSDVAKIVKPKKRGDGHSPQGKIIVSMHRPRPNGSLPSYTMTQVEDALEAKKCPANRRQIIRLMKKYGYPFKHSPR